MPQYAGSETPDKSSGGRRIIILSALLLLTVPLALVFVLFPKLTEHIGKLQLAGVFIVNFLVTLHVLPVPGVSALGQAAIVREANNSGWPRWAMGLSGGIGMGLGEIAPYYVGRLGSEVATERRIKAPGFLQPVADFTVRTITSLMHRWAWPVLFILAAVPNPIFEVAGLSAGSTKLSLWHFLPPTVLGKLVRGLVLVYIGTSIARL